MPDGGQSVSHLRRSSRRWLRGSQYSTRRSAVHVPVASVRHRKRAPEAADSDLGEE